MNLTLHESLLINVDYVRNGYYVRNSKNLRSKGGPSKKFEKNLRNKVGPSKKFEKNLRNKVDPCS